MIEEILQTIFQTENKLTNLIKIAEVKTYKPENHTAIVQFKDNDQTLSVELPILVPFTQDNKAYFPLKENQKVVVIFLPTGENTDGFIIGTYYDKTNPPPTKDKSTFNITFEDSTVIEYDKKNHKLYIHSTGDIEIISDTHITLKAPRIDLNP